jgi:hypothetical protein
MDGYFRYNNIIKKKLKKDRTKRKEKWIRNILSFLMTYLSSHLSILFSYVANSVPDFWTHSCIFQPPDDSWGGRVRNWHRPSDVLTFASCDTLWVLFFVCVWKRIYANVSIGGKNIQHSPPWTFLFFFPLDLCVNKSRWFIRSLPPIYSLAEYVNDWARPGQSSAVYRATTIFVSVCVCWLFLCIPK